MLSIGLPSALIPFLSAVSNGVLNNLVSSHGDTAVAAVGIAKKMDLLPANVAAGITQGTLPLLAYSSVPLCTVVRNYTYGKFILSGGKQAQTFICHICYA